MISESNQLLICESRLFSIINLHHIIIVRILIGIRKSNSFVRTLTPAEVVNDILALPSAPRLVVIK